MCRIAGTIFLCMAPLVMICDMYLRWQRGSADLSYALTCPYNFHKPALHSTVDTRKCPYNTNEYTYPSKLSCSTTDNLAALNASTGDVESKHYLQAVIQETNILLLHCIMIHLVLNPKPSQHTAASGNINSRR